MPTAAQRVVLVRRAAIHQLAFQLDATPNIVARVTGDEYLGLALFALIYDAIACKAQSTRRALPNDFLDCVSVRAIDRDEWFAVMVKDVR